MPDFEIRAPFEPHGDQPSAIAELAAGVRDGARFDELAAIIVDNLKAPDILALQEVQHDTGATDDGTVSAAQTFAELIAAIEAADPALSGVYDFAQIDPEDGQDGGQPGGNIRVGFLFRQDRTGLAAGDRGDASEGERGRRRLSPD